jgi:hypothetical protein
MFRATLNQRLHPKRFMQCLRKRRLPVLPFLAAVFLATLHNLAGAQTPRYQDVEAVATGDVALYICAQAYPAGLPKLKSKLDQSLQGLATPAATLRAAKAYAGLYNSQINAMLATTKKEREEFCKAATE